MLGAIGGHLHAHHLPSPCHQVEHHDKAYIHELFTQFTHYYSSDRSFAITQNCIGLALDKPNKTHGGNIFNVIQAVGELVKDMCSEWVRRFKLQISFKAEEKCFLK